MSDRAARSKSERSACPCSGANLDRLVQPAVLMVLCGPPLHGYRIVRKVSRLPTFRGKRPDSTGVYRVLRAMERRKLLSGIWDTSDRGPTRRLYRLTTAGRSCLERWVESLTHYQRAIARLAREGRRSLKVAASAKRYGVPEEGDDADEGLP